MDAREAARDRLAEIEEEHATLRSELAAFQLDYPRLVGVVELQVQELEAKVLAIVAARSGVLEDAVAADAAEQRFRETTTALGAIPAPAGPPPSDDLKRSSVTPPSACIPTSCTTRPAAPTPRRS